MNTFFRFPTSLGHSFWADPLSSPAQGRQYHYILVAKRASSLGMATDSATFRNAECQVVRQTSSRHTKSAP